MRSERERGVDGDSSIEAWLSLFGGVDELAPLFRAEGFECAAVPLPAHSPLPFDVNEPKPVR